MKEKIKKKHKPSILSRDPYKRRGEAEMMRIIHEIQGGVISKRAACKKYGLNRNTFHRYLSDWTPDKFIEQARAIDEDVAQYITMVIESKQHPEQAYKSCSGILSMLRKVGSERLAGACRRAHSYGVYNYPIIVQILEKNLDKLDSNEQEDQLLMMPQHYNIRGNEYYN